ncbi:MAG: RNA polymerase sigma factor [Bacteroidota bacterium]
MTKTYLLQAIRKEVTDTQIITYCQQASRREQGFRMLMSKYQERLYWHIRRMVIEHEDANDVLQNTLVKVYKGIPKFKGHSTLYTWLYRIATNESLTFLKRKNRNRTTSIEDQLTELANQLRADTYFDSNEAAIKLQQAIVRLPERQKMVFNMRYFEEMSYQEISDILETSVGGLKASYHHAAKKVEEYLKAHSE